MNKYGLFLWRSCVVLVFLGIILSFVKVTGMVFDLYASEESSAGRSGIDRSMPSGKLIALTFDDGPHPEYTLRLLDILEGHNAKATFFVVGKMAAKYPELVREISLRGHEIGNHTYEHRILTELSRQETALELAKAGDEAAEITGKRPVVFRPPSGRYNAGTIEQASSMGLFTILWENYSDYGAMRSSEVIANVLTGRSDGDIILLHSGIDATMLALPAILEKFKAEGFSPVTVSALLARNGEGSLKPGLVRSVRPFSFAKE